MPNPATLRGRRLRMTKAQLIDEIDTLEQRVAVLEIGREQALTERKRAEQGLAEKEAHLHTGSDYMQVACRHSLINLRCLPREFQQR